MYLVHRVLTQVHNVRCMVGNLSHAAPPKGSVDVSFQVSSARTMYAYAHLHLLIDSCTPAIPVLAVFLNLVYIPLLLQPVLSVLTILDWSWCCAGGSKWPRYKSSECEGSSPKASLPGCLYWRTQSHKLADWGCCDLGAGHLYSTPAVTLS